MNNDLVVHLAWGVLTFVSVIGNIWLSFFKQDTTKISPQPLRVVEETRYALHEDLEQLREEFDQFCKEQRRQNKDILSAGEQRARFLSARIEAIPRETIALLRETKNLL